MKLHVRKYFRHFNIGEQDIITCEWCGRQGRADGSGYDIHHLNGRYGSRANEIENLMLLCRNCHTDAHEMRIGKKELEEKHKKILRK